jgi:hypothetical protein
VELAQSAANMSGSMATEELINQARQMGLAPIDQARMVHELLRRELEATPNELHARRNLARRIGLSVDWLDNRVMVSRRAMEDPDVAKRIGALQTKSWDRVLPLGFSSWRLLLRVQPRERLLQVLDRLESLPPQARTYEGIAHVVDEVSGKEASPPRKRRGTEALDSRKSDAAESQITLTEAAPGLTAWLRGAGAEIPVEPLPLLGWWRMLRRDLDSVNRRLERVIGPARRRR